MKHKIKKIVIAITVLLGSSNAIADKYYYPDFEVDGIYYNILDNEAKTVEVSWKQKTFRDFDQNYLYFSDYFDSITIPTTVAYQQKEFTVISIASHAFDNCTNLKSVAMPNTLTQIQNDAFCNCDSLISITIPPKVTSIGYMAFYGCSNLKEVILQEGEQSIDFVCGNTNYRGVFSSCPLTKVFIGRDITLSLLYESYGSECLSNGPFSWKKSLTDITISNNVSTIPAYLFYEDANISNISLGNNIKSIGEYAFYNCTNLHTAIVPNSTTSIGRYAFYNCKSLKTAVIGNGITDLPLYLFESCDSLTTVYLGNSIKTISNKCFYGCSDLINIYLFSDNVTTLGTNAIPTTVSRIYVPDTKRYENLLNGYYTDNLITLNESTTEYNGKVPEFSYRNNVTGMNVSFNDSTTHIDAGSYNTNIDVIFSNENWSTQIAVPCSYNITKVPVTIIANDAKRQYGEENPEFSCSYFGFKNGETDSVLITRPTIATTATINSSVGSYPIIPTNAEAKNYTFTYERGILSITQASQSINWDQSFEKVFIGDQIELTAEATSGLAIKYSVSDESIAEIYTSNGKTYLDCIKNGEVTIKANQSGNDNYLAADRVSKTIVINKISGVNSVENHNNAIEVARYDIHGRLLSEPTRGINIIKMSDGSTRKEIVK